jgi:hypothetical protein
MTRAELGPAGIAAAFAIDAVVGAASTVDFSEGNVGEFSGLLMKAGPERV